MIKIDWNLFLKHRCWFGWYWIGVKDYPNNGYWGYSHKLEEKIIPVFRRPRACDQYIYD